MNRQDVAQFAQERGLPQPATLDEFFGLMQVIILDSIAQSVQSIADKLTDISTAMPEDPDGLVELREPEDAPATAPKRSSSRRKKSSEE